MRRLHENVCVRLCVCVCVWGVCVGGCVCVGVCVCVCVCVVCVLHSVACRWELSGILFLTWEYLTKFGPENI
jgi:hypothetical protein